MRSRTAWILVATLILGLVLAGGCAKKAEKTEAEQTMETGQVATPADTTQAAQQGEMVACQVCGQQVEKAKAPTGDYEGTTYYFCCDGCKARFVADPKQFITQQT